MGVEPVLLRDPAGDLLQAHPVLGGHQLHAVRAVGQRVELGPDRGDPGAQPGQLLGLSRGSLLGRLPLGPGQLDGRLDPRDGPPGSLGHGAGDGRVAGTPGQPGGRPLAGLALGGSGAGQGVPAAGNGPHPLLERAHLEPGLHLRGARNAAPRAEPADVRFRGAGAAGGTGPVVLLGLRLGQPPLQILEAGQSGLPCPLRRRDRGADPPGLFPGGPGRAGQQADPPGALGRGAVGPLQPGLSPGQDLAGPFLVRQRAGQLALGVLAALLRGGQPGRCGIGRGPSLQQARRLRRSALGPVRPEQVSLPGNHP